MNTSIRTPLAILLITLNSLIVLGQKDPGESEALKTSHAFLGYIPFRSHISDLNISYDHDSIKYSFNKAEEFNSYKTIKIADQYVIGIDHSNTYLFYNIARKQLFILYKHFAFGFGNVNYTYLSKRWGKLSEKIRNGTSRKIILLYLIKYAKYDYRMHNQHLDRMAMK